MFFFFSFSLTFLFVCNPEKNDRFYLGSLSHVLAIIVCYLSYKCEPGSILGS